MFSIVFDGHDLRCLLNEAGGHRVQRTPEGERRGRVHSSTVTVYVTDLDARRDDCQAELRSPKDFEVSWYSGSGAGGQHRNKHQNSVRLRHLPTGMVVTSQCRKREESLRSAMAEMNRRLDDVSAARSLGSENLVRTSQIGSGMRRDKRRTYRFQDGLVTDHVTGITCDAKSVMRGHLDKLWPGNSNGS